jgi:hypothetical protein
MSDSPVIRWLGVLAFTATLAGGLLLLDRGLGGPRAHGGLIEVAALGDLPTDLGPRMSPTYFPASLRWPPAQVRWRRAGGRAWWLGVDAAQGERALWMGAAEGPRPGAPHEIAGCLPTPDPAADPCPPGWHTHTRPLVQGFTMFIVTRLPPEEAEIILKGLERGERPR